MDKNDPETIRTNYPSNSHKPKEPAKKAEKKREPIEKVISGEAIQRKKGLGRRIADTFTGDDAKSVGAFVLFDVIIPAAKAMVSDAASQGVERMLFGDSRRSSSSRSNFTSYNKMHSSTRAFEPERGRREMSYKARASHDFDEVVLATRGEAEEVIDRLSALIDQYDVATVSDLYDLVGITGSFTDDKWGWSDIRGAGVARVRDGYLLNLPKTSPID